MRKITICCMTYVALAILVVALFGCNKEKNKQVFSPIFSYTGTISLDSTSNEVLVDLLWSSPTEQPGELRFTLNRDIELHPTDGVGKLPGDDIQGTVYSINSVDLPIRLRYSVSGDAVLANNATRVIELSHQMHWLPALYDKRYHDRFTYRFTVDHPKDAVVYGLGTTTKISAVQTVIESAKPTTVCSVFASTTGNDPIVRRVDNITSISLVDTLSPQKLATLLAKSSRALMLYESMVPDNGIPDTKLFVLPSDTSRPASIVSYATEEGSIRLGYVENDRYLDYVISHELAHLWWNFGKGGNDGPNGFLNESFAEYFSWLYYKELFGEEAFTTLIERNKRRIDWNNFTLNTEGNFDGPARINTTLYVGGGLIVHSIHHRLGDVDFKDFLEKLFADKPATITDFGQWITENYGNDDRLAEPLQRLSLSPSK